MADLERSLVGTSFCEGMQPSHISLLARDAGERSFQAGQFVFHEGDEANFLYILLKGHVSLEVSTPARGAIVFQTIGAGDALGLSWLFPPFRWHFDARAIEPTQTIVLDAGRLRAQIEEDHDFGYELLIRIAKVMITRLQATRLQMTDMYGVGDS